MKLFLIVSLLQAFQIYGDLRGSQYKHDIEDDSIGSIRGGRQLGMSSMDSDDNMRGGGMNDNIGRGGTNSERNFDITLPFEMHPGMCQDAELVWSQFPDIQNRKSLLEFQRECGFGGSCFDGEAQGCCRFAGGRASGGPPYECDRNGQNFRHAYCVCNEHTAPPFVDRAGGNGQNGPGINILPPPTPAPTTSFDNCKRFDPSSPFFDERAINPFTFVAQTDERFKTCTENSDCIGHSGSTGCCVQEACICDSSLIHIPNVRCTG